MENESCNLYLEASASGIEVAWFSLAVEQSMAIQFEDTYAIALDRARSLPEPKPIRSWPTS